MKHLRAHIYWSLLSNRLNNPADDVNSQPVVSRTCSYSRSRTAFATSSAALATQYIALQRLIQRNRDSPLSQSVPLPLLLLSASSSIHFQLTATSVSLAFASTQDVMSEAVRMHALHLSHTHLVPFHS